MPVVAVINVLLAPPPFSLVRDCVLQSRGRKAPYSMKEASC